LKFYPLHLQKRKNWEFKLAVNGKLKSSLLWNSKSYLVQTWYRDWTKLGTRTDHSSDITWHDFNRVFRLP